MNDPSSIRIRRLSSGDLKLFQELVRLFAEVFETKTAAGTDEKRLEDLLRKSEFVVLAALDADQVVGGLTGYELPMYSSDALEMFLYDIAVLPKYHRQGIGSSLLSELRDYCASKKIGSIFVDALKEDKEAVDFYRATGGSGEEVVHFSYEIRS
ncbi:AAC(3)-I family aminoglycoside 3-N-acetyltransferase [Leptospira yasudae]|uniref:GNAT family N-acetyltransferase n=1 Tax=Leptospira yasudae TaxID=2202201 RepID=UPI000E59DB71|nr:GNAT family N-acetyltransferase [Leptospira yasudae]RHX89511.1 AAC(3)-I family aminoglycoside 3-N-acetyltransferase [Leptospira yasudae]TGM95846.1 GNAT family N-acetyltransferase [Leptospira yasudae]